MVDLENKVVLMAGGAGYLAAPACGKLVECGASIVIADLNDCRAEEVAQSMGAPERVMSMALDVGDEESCKAAVTQTVRRFGKLDVLVNSTYLSSDKSVEDLTWQEFDSAMHVNLTGTFMLAREAANAMRQGGNIVLFGSMYGLVAPTLRNYPPPMNPNPIEYGVAKAGIVQMTRYLAVYWASRNIRVNCISPGPFPHERTQREHPDFMQGLASSVPLGRIGNQWEVAGAVAFLASDEASYITGQNLSVDGGWTAW